MQVQEVIKNTENRPIKALLCQIKPYYKQKTQSISRVRKSLELYSKSDEVDIVLFPEMSFTGYNFIDGEDALPFAVKQGEGEQFLFGRELAQQMNTYVAFGYIEKVQSGNTYQLYDAAAVLNRSGQVICNYRKCHLYYNDKLWATQGQQFESFQLKNTKQQVIRCALAICMDINPKDFTSGEYELADFVVKTQSEVILFLTNWVDSEKNQISSNDVAATYNYWIGRLKPILKSNKTVLFLAADRVGKEHDYFAKKEIMFYGSSCAMMFNPTKILKNLDIESESYLMIDTFLP